MSKMIKLDWILPYADCLHQTESGVWCKICEAEFQCNQKSHVQQHITSTKHKKKSTY